MPPRSPASYRRSKVSPARRAAPSTRRVISLILLCTPAFFAQPTITGIVVDAAGNPVANASISHLTPEFSHNAVHTDKQGRFKVTTSAPRIVIRGPHNSSLQSASIRPAQSLNNLHIVLNAAPSNARPFCAAPARDFFQFPMNLVGGNPESSGDGHAWTKTYTIHTPGGPNAIHHGGGLVWGGGTPPDKDVWASEEFSETAAMQNGRQIIESQGITTAGGRWRNIGVFGESLGYRDASPAAAKELDRIIDNICISPSPAEPKPPAIPPSPFKPCEEKAPKAVLPRFRLSNPPRATYTFRTLSGSHTLTHTWMPDPSIEPDIEFYAATSVQAAELVYSLPPYEQTDRRGIREDGVLWRAVHQPGEWIVYRTNDPAAARHFDAVIDNACIVLPQ